jgi:hypothetical protein
LKVFFDHNLSPHLVHLIDLFAPTTKDRVWMSALGAEGGWVVISADRRIFRNKLKREAWRQSRLIVFFLAPQWRRARHLEIAWRLLRLWPRIVDQARIVAPPAAFELPFGSGKLRVLRG